MLQAAALKMLLLVDGFIASAAYLVAASLHPAIKQYSIACHQSAERGHRLLLEYLGLRPVLQLEMRLGEGTGCAMAYPILQGAVAFLCDMASFDEAGVSEQLWGFAAATPQHQAKSQHCQKNKDKSSTFPCPTAFFEAAGRGAFIEKAVVEIPKIAHRLVFQALA